RHIQHHRTHTTGRHPTLTGHLHIDRTTTGNSPHRSTRPATAIQNPRRHQRRVSARFGRGPRQVVTRHIGHQMQRLTLDLIIAPRRLPLATHLHCPLVLDRLPHREVQVLLQQLRLPRRILHSFPTRRSSDLRHIQHHRTHTTGRHPTPTGHLHIDRTTT